MEARAIMRSQPISAQKVRIVCDAVRGMQVEKALDMLAHTNKKAAKLVYKVLVSCIANAENNHSMDIDALSVKRIFADDAKILKRMHARARGRGDRILKRTCHVTVVVGD